MAKKRSSKKDSRQFSVNNDYCEIEHTSNLSDDFVKPIKDSVVNNAKTIVKDHTVHSIIGATLGGAAVGTAVPIIGTAVGACIGAGAAIFGSIASKNKKTNDDE